MSGISYPKPLSSTTFFNPANFISSEELQTISGVLEYPTAQGTQTFNDLRLDNTSIVLGENATNSGSRNVVLGKNATTTFDDSVVIQDAQTFKDGTLSIGLTNSRYEMEGMKNNLYHYQVIGNQSLGRFDFYKIVKWETPIRVPTTNFLTPTATTGSLAYAVFENTSGRTIVVVINAVLELRSTNPGGYREWVIDKNQSGGTNPTNPVMRDGCDNDPDGQDGDCIRGIVVLEPNETVCLRARQSGGTTAYIDASNSASDKLPNLTMVVF